MIDGFVRRLHRAVSPAAYRLLVELATIAASALVAGFTVVVVSLYFDPPLHDVVVVLLVSLVATTLAVAGASFRSRDAYRALEQWRRTATPTPRETAAAWATATTFYLRRYQCDAAFVSLSAAVPAGVVAFVLWDIGWRGLGALALAAIVPSFYATVLSYSVGETMLRPIVREVAAHLQDGFDFEPSGLTVATRLAVLLPTYTTMAGLTTVGLVGNQGGAGRLALAAGVSLIVGLFFAVELRNLLTGTISRPIADVRRQLARVRAGEYDARSLVLGGDEIGELSRDFNLMAAGLAEREELRHTFGTYVDEDVARLILEGRVSREGAEVDVSILFVDVRGFTTYAERVAAPQVVAALNTLFGEIVPVIGSFGGHVDKFLGDGLMAVFGAPDPRPDHADRAVAAARTIVDAVGLGESGLRVGAGVNSGRVVAGPLGGAGRLNFSVIGDAVNVAARVEAATRETGDDLLVAAATRDLLSRPEDLVSRGTVVLKGKREPVEVFAPR